LKRLVVDPNTLASGIVDPASEKPPRLIFDAIGDLAFELIVCPEVLREVRKTLRKPYFKKLVDVEEARKAVARIERVAIEREDPKEVEEVLRDPKDDYLLALAREAEAEAIVTGDKDLLDHKGELKPKAINAREACELLGLI
jgi:putative PIN family toxin of toxin-antitoxin system